jgi:hypothetical protein
LPTTNLLPKRRAPYQNFVVAISAKSDHSEAFMILEHNGYSIEAFATQSKRQWTVRMTVRWHDAHQEKHRLFGPYESFQSQNDAEAWGLNRCIELIESGLELPSKITRHGDNVS